MSGSGAPPVRLFAVVTWGRAGSRWLAKALSAHPDVFCLHNFRAYIRGSGFDVADFTDEQYLVAVAAHATEGYRLAGDCHAIWQENVPALRNRFGDEFRACVLTRHPISRLESAMKFADKVGYGRFRLDYEGPRRLLPAAFQDRAHDDETMFFVHYMNMVNSIIYMDDAGPIYAMEDLTRDAAPMNRLLDYLSAGELQFAPGQLDSSFRTPLNVGSGAAGNGRPMSLAERFRRWPDWQQDLFAAMLDPDARVAYEALGYAFPFQPAPPEFLYFVPVEPARSEADAEP